MSAETTSLKLLVELISLSGLQEEKDFLRTIQIFLVFGSHQTQCSRILDVPSNGDAQINAQFSFIASDSITSFKETSDSLTIYICQQMSKRALLTTPSRLTTVYQPTGLDFSSNIVAQAVLDCRIALLHGNDILSAELVPSSNDGVIDTAYRGVMFLKLSLDSSAISSLQQLQNIRNNPLEVEKIEDSLRISEQYIEKINFEQYQKLKGWYATLRSRHAFIVERKIKILALDEFGRHR